jgi:hypothetical protein
VLILEFFPCPQRGKMLIETDVKNGARAPEERNRINTIVCKWNLMGCHSSFFSGRDAKDKILLILMTGFAPLRLCARYFFFHADLHRKNSADLFLLICGIFPENLRELFLSREACLRKAGRRDAKD